MKFTNKNRAYVRGGVVRGFTLVELLVVIAIMAALTALMLPRLRVVNKDRNIREAARVVGSKFAEASDRARLDGKASLTIVRNPNFLDADGVEYGGTQLYLSRAVPNYIGDDVPLPGDPGPAILTSANEVSIPRPIEWVDDPASRANGNVIREGDRLRIGKIDPVSSTVLYVIETVDLDSSGSRLILGLETPSTKPRIPYDATALFPGNNVFFVIERQPKILRSSITDLPAGYLIDLRLSGPVQQMENGTGETSALADNIPAGTTPAPVRTIFHELLRPALVSAPDSVAKQALIDQHRRIEVQFDSSGGISSVRHYYGNWNTTTGPGSLGFRRAVSLQQPLQLFITPSLVGTTDSPIYQDSNLWVTVNNTSGGVSIGYNNPPLTVTSGLLQDLIPAARAAASTGVSSAQ